MYATQQTPRPMPVPRVRRSQPLQQQPTQRSLQSRQQVQARQQVRRNRQVAELTREALVKLTVNGVLMAVATTTLVRLLPSYLSHQAQLRDIQQELDLTESRVSRLQSDFNQAFDPMQAKAVMQQQSYRVDPSEKIVVWTSSRSSEVMDVAQP